MYLFADAICAPRGDCNVCADALSRFAIRDAICTPRGDCNTQMIVPVVKAMVGIDAICTPRGHCNFQLTSLQKFLECDAICAPRGDYNLTPRPTSFASSRRCNLRPLPGLQLNGLVVDVLKLQDAICAPRGDCNDSI